MAFLIDKYIPAFTFHEVHKRQVKASAKECFFAAKHLDMRRSLITKILLQLRGLPVSDLSFEGFLKNMCFSFCGEDLNNEFVIDASQPSLKIFWNFYFAEEAGKTLVRTETRILCLTEKSRLRFSLYWFFVKPFSGLIRREMLRLIKQKAENN